MRPKEKPRIVAAIRKVLRAHQTRDAVDVVRIAGKPFVVYAGVFSPAVFPGTAFFARVIPFRSEEDFLEIGSGAGVIGVLASLHGARRVVATDINPKAAENTRDNARRHGVSDKIRAVVGDVYDPLDAGECFDTIFWNMPFVYVKPRSLTLLERGAFDPGYASIRRFIAGAPNHLKEHGRLLMGFSKTAGDATELLRLLHVQGFAVSVLASAPLSAAAAGSLELYEATLSSNE